MRTAIIKYVKGARKTYPQWHNITDELTDKFQNFHTDLRSNGYAIKSSNIAEKDGELFWILLNKDGWYNLEHYATII